MLRSLIFYGFKTLAGLFENGRAAAKNDDYYKLQLLLNECPTLH